VDSLIRRYQHEPVRHEVESKGVSVEKMTHVFLQVHEMDKVKVAASIIRGNGRTMVFSATKHGCDRLARKLSEEGVEARAIHGDLRQNMRERSLGQFSKGKVQALVATDVAARGIHVDDVDVVIHFDPPADHKTYVHRSGRTARAGESGVVVTLVLWNQELEVRRMQKRLGLDIQPVEVFSNDERLSDLSKFEGHTG
jgi:superfamily II DNA/RNA helicase